jgi:hypothetical protein
MQDLPLSITRSVPDPLNVKIYERVSDTVSSGRAPDLPGCFTPKKAEDPLKIH